MKSLGVFRAYNSVAAWRSRRQPTTSSCLPELNEIIRHSAKEAAISDHLTTLFAESLSINPRLIVELGVRGGDSTFVLARVARLCDARLISVDIDDCSGALSDPRWQFFQRDDLEFAKEFRQWHEEQGLTIDVLFIDTSHMYEHTVLEIEAWFPFLSDKSKVFFHDTNMRAVYFRKDGRVGFTRDNSRGVIRAIEQYFGRSFNESVDFVDVCGEWLIKHYSYGSGFTILERLTLPKQNNAS